MGPEALEIGMDFLGWEIEGGLEGELGSHGGGEGAEIAERRSLREIGA
jgi:hypothetical protein